MLISWLVAAITEIALMAIRSAIARFLGRVEPHRIEGWHLPLDEELGIPRVGGSGLAAVVLFQPFEFWAATYPLPSFGLSVLA